MGWINAATARALLKACEHQGVPRHKLLAEAALSLAQIEGADARLSQDELQRLWATCLERTGDLNLSIHAAECLAPGVYEVVDFMMLHAPTLGEGLKQAAHYFPLIHTGIRLQTEETPQECILDVCKNQDPQAARPGGEYSLAAFALRARQALDAPLNFLRVECAYPEPEDRSELDRFFTSPLQFNASSNRLVFSPGDWARTPKKAEGALFRLLEDHAARVEKELPTTQTLASQVTRLISQELRGGRPLASHIAKLLGMSERTLQRKLKEEGTAFSDLLDKMRARFSETYLAQGLSQGEVSHLLGFSEVSSFHRAHKRWTGRSPGAN